MKIKKSARDRFLDSYLDVIEDWDHYLAELTEDESMLQLQEEFGNKTNDELGREMWYSNDFFINSRILDFITSNDKDDKLINELKNVYVGKLAVRGLNAEALNIVEEFDGYLVVINYDLDLQIKLISRLVGYYLYGLHPNVSIEYSKMRENLLYLIDEEEFLKLTKEEIEKDEKVDLNNITHRQHIETDLYVAAMDFIIGHEIGHHFLKHTDVNGRNIFSEFTPLDMSFDQMHLDEYAADNFGLGLVIRGMKKRNRNTLFAPLMVILMFSINDRNPEEPSLTHPSFKNRYQNLLNKLSSEFDEGAAMKLQNTFNDLATWIYDNELFSKKNGHWDTKWWK